MKTIPTTGLCIRVAVLGSKGSGKTVFLTSLANHLLNRGPAMANCELLGEKKF